MSGCGASEVRERVLMTSAYMYRQVLQVCYMYMYTHV